MAKSIIAISSSPIQFQSQYAVNSLSGQGLLPIRWDYILWNGRVDKMQQFTVTSCERASFGIDCKNIYLKWQSSKSGLTKKRREVGAI